MKDLRIVIVDDHEVVRLGLRTMLDRHPGFRVVAEAGDAAEAIEASVQHKPDVVIMDLRLPVHNGIDAIRGIVRRLPRTRVLALTAFAEDDLLFEAIEAGASGYLLKDIATEKLIASLESLARGEALIDPKMTNPLLNRIRSRETNTTGDAFALLTWRERRILELLAEGTTNREIGAALRLSPKTIRNYVSQILAKLGVRSRTQAAAYAIEHRLKGPVPSRDRS